MKSYLYKYLVELKDDDPLFNSKVVLPINSKILTASIVNGQLVIYAFVDPTETQTKQYDMIVGLTGNAYTIEEMEIISKLRFLGTHLKGSFVFHVWIKE